MANGIRALPVPDIGRALREGLGVYRDIKGIELAEAATERKRIKEDEERLLRERATMARTIEGRPLKEQVQVMDRYIKQASLRGDNPAPTIEMRDLLMGTPEQNAEAQVYIRNARIEGESAGLIKPPFKAEAPTALEKNIRLLHDPTLSPEDRAIVLANLKGEGFMAEIDPDGSIVIKTGKGLKPSLQKRTLGTLEKNLLSADRNIMNLKTIKETFAPEYFTYLGRGKAFLGALKEKAGFKLSPEQKAFVQKRKRFVQSVNQFFNKYRHDITGAQAAWREIQNLKNAVINPDLSPSEFTASLDQLYSKVLRTRRLMRKVYREGFEGSFRDKKSEAAQQLDSLYLEGADDSMLDRATELRETHEPEEIYRILDEEGYDPV